MLHPQCLDFKPPFRPLRELEFCVMYKEFGCCDYQKDQELMAKYYQIMDNFDYYGYANCASFVVELLCQVGMHGQRSLGSVHSVSIMLPKGSVQTPHSKITDLKKCRTL